MNGWYEDWVRLYFIEVDYQQFEEAERKTQGRPQMDLLGERDVEQLKRKQQTICESLAFFKQPETRRLRDSVKKGKTEDVKLRELQDK